MNDVLRVGVIGANAEGGWAGEAHVPAIKALPGFELAGVATSNRASAERASAAFGVAGYDDGRKLIADPTIDIVTVATRVPDHRDLLLEAIAAGKHVYCEWPLGKSMDEAEELWRVADRASVHHAIGLQLRESPTTHAARHALRSGAIGRVLSVNAFSSTAGFGPDVAPQFAYLEDPASFANLVTIQGAHTLDLLLALLGDIQSVSALLTRQFPSVRVEGEGRQRDRKTFDHLLTQGIIGEGVSFTVEVAGGRKGKTPFWLEIIGDKGRISLHGGAPRGLQSARVSWTQNDQLQPVDEGILANLSDSAANVGGVYTALRRDIVNNSRTVTGFDHATQLTGIVTGLFDSSNKGRRQSISTAPQLL
jgi:predicted dehydrogenase